MKIIYKNGDVLDSPEPFIAHGCNAQGAFGSGVAGAIAKRHPEAKEAYHKHHKEFGLNLGDVIYAETDNGKIICHCITQDRYGYDGKKYVSYDAIRTAMKELNNAVEGLLDVYPNEGNQVSMPKIGAGLAGGDWGIIEKIIEEESTNFQPVVYIYND